MNEVALKLRCSFHQERLWFIDKFETANVYPAQPVYHNIPLLLCLEGEIDRARLECGLNKVVRRHGALRTTIRTEEEIPYQWIRDEIHVPLSIEDRLHEQFDRRNRVQVDAILSHCLDPMSLDANALLAARLFAFSNHVSVLLVTIHHAVADRRSADIVAAEILTMYEALQHSLEPAWDEPDLQYSDFSEWQRSLTPNDWEPYLFYWKRQLAGRLEILDLPTDKPRAAIHIFNPGQIVFPLNARLLGNTSRIAGALGLSTKEVFFGAWILLLQRYSSLTEINVGVAMSNRKLAGAYGVVGPVANLVSIRALVDVNCSREEFFAEIKRLLTDADAFQDLPFEPLVLEVAPEPDMSRTALFDVLFAYESPTDLPAVAGLAVSKVENNLGLGKYDLNLLVKEERDGAAGYLVYNANIYREDTAQRLVHHYANLLESLAEEFPGELLNHDEVSLVRDRWNSTDAAYPKTETIASLFEQAARTWPERIALEQGDVALSYEGLDTRANQLANYLQQSRGIKHGDHVAISLDPTTQMIVVVLAVLKVGAAYVPIDPALPPGRKTFMIDDAGCSLMIVDGETEPTSPLYVNVNKLDLNLFSSVANASAGPEPESPAYVIYTSGSTGVPKGCQVSHRNVVRLMRNDRQEFGFDEHDVWIMAHSLSFDFSVWEIWGALLYGGKLVLPNRSQSLDVIELLKLVVAGRVTVLNQTPDSFYFLSTIAMKDRARDLAGHLRMVVFGGAKLDPTRLKSWVRRYPLDRIRLINMYGITETTVHVTYHQVTEHDVNCDHSMSVIGRPLPETRVYIGDARGRLCPVGVWGEIHVGGTGVASGYLNRPELTAEKFNVRPALGPGRLFASGDIGRWRGDGTLEYLGRRDTQVKVRGFRIESDEVAFFLNQHPTIGEAVVTSRVNRNTHTGELVAFYTESLTHAQGNSPTSAILRDHLAGFLPTYMIPTLFVPVPRIPLNSSGKVDWRSLEALSQDATVSDEREYVAPRDLTEHVIADIWARCLSRTGIGIHDNYFDLGGHSLSAAKIVAEINAEIPGDMKLSDIFRYPTVSQLAAHLSKHTKADVAGPAPIAELESYPASPAQERIWTHQQFDIQRNIYNVPAAFRLIGQLEPAALSYAMDELVARHESLRTSFRLCEGSLHQVVSDHLHLKICFRDFSEREQKEELAQHFVRADAVAPFDLSQAPLLRVGLLTMGPQDHVLVVTLHHIVSDGWSLDVLKREVSTIYEAHRRGLPHHLPPMPYHYKDFTAWLRASSESTTNMHLYWRTKLAPPLAEPTLRRLSTVPTGSRDFHGNTLIFRMRTELTEAIRGVARAEESSLFVLLLAFVKVLLFKYTSEPDVIVGSPVAGRQLVGLENQIGCYIKTLPLRDVINDDVSFSEFVKRVRQTVLEALDHQECSFQSLPSEDESQIGTGGNPLFAVAVILQNQPQSALEIDGLEVSSIPVRKETSLFDLVFEFRDASPGLELHLSYRSLLFSQERMERLWTHLEMLVARCLEDPSRLVGDVCVLPKEEMDLLVATSRSQIATRTLPGMNLVDAFESACVRYPDRVAVAMYDNTISYADLDFRSDVVARALVEEYKVEDEDVVAFYFQPSIEALVAIIGVLKAGAAYLPIDPNWPERRIEYVLDNSGSRVVLVGAGFDSNGRRFGQRAVFALDAERVSNNLSFRRRRIRAEQLAYVIYTSGSTGTPKGVLIEHRSVVNLVAGLDSWIYGDNPPGLNVACVASFTFDASVQQIFATLLLGHTLHPVPAEVKKNPAELAVFVRERSIDIIDMTPSLFQMLLRVHPDYDLCPALKHLIIGGEALSSWMVDEFFRGGRNHGVVINNVYGPTESTVDVTCHICLPGADISSVPIGRPLPNLRLYVLDAKLRQVPFGDCGEICIAGAGLARGYVDPEVPTDAKFVAGRHLGEDRIYRTGDVGRWRRDGNLEFLGRLDRQIKLRGHRVELDEIEAKVRACAGVDGAVVTLVGEGANRSLCAYYTGNTEVSDAQLRTYLREHLPSSMIPTFIVRLLAIPMNSSGKIDHRALPKPAVSENGSGSVAVSAPLVAICRDVLKLGEVDVHKSFFELGGNSLSAIFVLSHIYEQLGVSIELADFYAAADLLSLSELVESLRGAPALPQTATDPSGDSAVVPLTMPQKRIWVQCELDTSGSAYHMPGSLGYEERIDDDAIRASLTDLATTHQALRLQFERGAVDIFQRVGDKPEYEFEIVDLSGECNVDQARQRLIAERLMRPFNHERGPLFRFLAAKLSAQRYEILYNFHHLIVDGWSLEVLKREFMERYRAHVSGVLSVPRPPVRGYIDYVRFHQAQLCEHEGANKATQYWARLIHEGMPLPQTLSGTGWATLPGQGFGGHIDRTLRDAVRSEARAQGTTSSIVLFTAFLVLLRRFYQSDQVAAYLIHAGRDRAEFKDTVGVFVSPLAVVSRIRADTPSAQIVRSVHTEVQALLKHQSFPMELALDRLGAPPFAPPFAFNMLDLPDFARRSEHIKLGPYSGDDIPAAKFDLEVYVADRDDGLEMFWSFDGRRFDLPTVEYLHGEFDRLVRQIAATVPPQARTRKKLMLPKAKRS